MEYLIPEELKFNRDGLIPAIVQDVATGQVLMLAYMNKEALSLSLATGQTWFFSRSRGELWHKGATSGHYQHIVNIFYDCDGDALLVQVRQEGVACHEGEFSCFHNPLRLPVSPEQDRARGTVSGGHKVSWPKEKEAREHKVGYYMTQGAAASSGSNEKVGTFRGEMVQGMKRLEDSRTTEPRKGLEQSGQQADARDISDLGQILVEVFEVIKKRQRELPEGSYTARLFKEGQDRILKKIGEEATEVVLASKGGRAEEILYELADLYYHTLVALAYHGLELGDLARELASRRR